MKRIGILILCVGLTGACTSLSKPQAVTEKAGQSVAVTGEQRDTTPKVNGIGGIFFFSENPAEARAWYAENLGLEVNEWGSTFEFRNANKPDEINYLQWSPFRRGSSYFSPSKREFMINYRVQNLDGLLRKLKQNGITILDSVETVEYGRFVHIMDPEGQKIELWEPVDSVLTGLGSKTTK